MPHARTSRGTPARPPATLAAALRMANASPEHHWCGRPVVLWIDDEVTSDNPGVVLLRADGIDIDIASSGHDGLRKALAAPYDGIILDLCLPDLPGIEVLEALSVIHASILVLTGYPDTAVAFAAARLGAIQFKTKPLSGDSLTRAVWSLITSQREGVASPMDDPRPGRSRHCAASDMLLNQLRKIESEWEAERKDPQRDRLVGTVVTALARNPRALNVRSFLSCAEVLRSAVRDGPGLPSDKILRCIELLQTNAQADDNRAEVTERAIHALGGMLAQHIRATEDQLARKIGVHRSHLGRLIWQHTGLRFRTWRLALAMREAVRQLVISHDYVAHIGYQLGYEYPTQFTHDFRELFGISPRAFRRIAQRTPM